MRQRTRDERHTLQRRTHSGAFGVADTVHFCNTVDTSSAHSLDNNAHNPVLVVFRSVTWLEALAWRGYVCVAHVGKDVDVCIIDRHAGTLSCWWHMANYTHAELVRTALETEREIRTGDSRQGVVAGHQKVILHTARARASIDFVRSVVERPHRRQECRYCRQDSTIRESTTRRYHPCAAARST